MLIKEGKDLHKSHFMIAFLVSSTHVSLILSAVNSFVFQYRNYRLFAFPFPLAIFQTGAKVITKYAARDTCLVNSITLESRPYYPTYSKSIPADVYGGWNLFRSHPPPTDRDDIFRGWYSKIGGLSVEGSVSFRWCGVRHRGRKSDTFHIIHTALVAREDTSRATLSSLDDGGRWAQGWVEGFRIKL